MSNSDHSSYEDQSSSNKGQSFNSQITSTPQNFSPEDLEILKECNRESFWFRCVPFTIAFVGSTHYLTQRGILKANPKYGSLLKCMVASLFGFIVGKVSYMGICKEKFLNNENSQFGNSMRRSKRTYNTEGEDEQFVAEDHSQNKDTNTYNQLRIQNRNQNISKGGASPNTPEKYANYSEPAKLRIPGKKNKYGDMVDADE